LSVKASTIGLAFFHAVTAAVNGDSFYFRGSSYRMRGKEPVTLNAKGEGFLSTEKV
jgi:hypothetical protein